MTRRGPAEFLERNPRVRAHIAAPLWARIRQRFQLIDPESAQPPEYIVRGDALGTEDDLLVDVLARGCAPESTDPLARELFLSLPAELQTLVLKELRREP